MPDNKNDHTGVGRSWPRPRTGRAHRATQEKRQAGLRAHERRIQRGRDGQRRLPVSAIQWPVACLYSFTVAGAASALRARQQRTDFPVSPLGQGQGHLKQIAKGKDWQHKRQSKTRRHSGASRSDDIKGGWPARPEIPVWLQYRLAASSCWQGCRDAQCRRRTAHVRSALHQHKCRRG
ncbi:hypothetical protein SAMN05216288_0275 [Pseudomonas punonensis]|uniref:Uncharacterized protein n=1 Tax=Phytopseudomonas punonensis TaxID=1220495 RepID=A0A1M7ND49_9GAMM|nr:hypothetical protein SAMN05216288_0275 [Pseudomonas punonensis]